MKFNEKLIQLRKKEGLSQEELGYKLNVTRQTVSKWELGQTTPEMDKIVIMSKIFNISADELINESEVTSNQNSTNEDQPIEKENTKNNKKTIMIIAGVLIVVIVLVIGIGIIFNNQRNSVLDKFFGIVDKTTDAQENRVSGVLDKATDIIDQVADEQEDSSSMQNEFSSVLDKVSSTIDQTAGNHNQSEEKIAIRNFNDSIETFSGTNNGVRVKDALDKVITSNKTKDKKITVKYMATETQDESKIKSIKQNIGSFDNYQVTFEYDANGFINKTIINKL